MSTVQFDVVIPAAGAEKTLERAAASALQSSLLAHLMIVVDGDPLTLAVANKLEKTDARVQVFYTDAGGPGAARNRGLAEATADWVAFLDADDEYAPGYLEALAELIGQNPQVSLVHTRLVRRTPVEGGSWQELDNHPLRFRFEHGNRVADLEQEPHMVGTSVAAAAFRRAVLETTKVRFEESLPWSEDADFITRFLLESAPTGQALEVGFCADATYFYTVGAVPSTTSSAWSQSDKYVLPFTKLYLPWITQARTHISPQTSLPRWLQNVLLYELFWYVDADRQVFHPSQQLATEVRQQCARLITQVAGAIDYEAVQNYALTSPGLERRMLLAAHTRGVPAVVSNQVIEYSRKPWQKARKFTYFFQPGEEPDEAVFEEGKLLDAASERWVSHTLFGLELVRERILWFEADEPEMIIFGRHERVAPFAGYPKIPVPSGLSVAGQEPAPSTKTQAGLLMRARRALWRLRHRNVVKNPPQKPEDKLTWFYMDRAHRAGDNAEVFYAFAREHAPQVRHIFALSRSSDDWERLAASGFELVDADNQQALAAALAEADELLLSDISDRVLAPLLMTVRANQRIVFLQHGVTRKQVWRWLNPRRIDVLVTSSAAESELIAGDGSHFVLSMPEIWQVGMPRLDRLVERRAAEPRRDVLLIAPTWEPSLRDSDDHEALARWVADWTAWVPQEFLAEDSQLKPVFFVHPNMEAVLERCGIEIPFKRVTGSEVPAALAQSIALVTDRSSLADEAEYIGVPALLVLPEDKPDPLEVRQGYSVSGFKILDSTAELPMALRQARAKRCELPQRTESNCQGLLKRLLAH